MVFNLDYSQYLTTYFLQQAHHVHQIYEKCVKESRKKNKKSDNSLPKCINFLIHYSFKITKTMNWSNDQTTRQNITNFKKGNNKGIIFGILVVSYKLCYNHLLFLSLPFSPQDDAENVLMKRRVCEVARRMGCWTRITEAAESDTYPSIRVFNVVMAQKQYKVMKNYYWWKIHVVVWELRIKGK